MGDLPAIFDVIPKIVDKVTKDFKIKQKSIPKDYIQKLKQDETIITSDLFKEVKLFQLLELSLQQAVTLACLLMNVEIEFQKYTEKIPTVGGVIKLAIINKEGFNFLSGDDVKTPNNI